jgi:hypothetical protein
MNEQIKELAEQSGLGFLYKDNWLCTTEIERFAKLVAANEREACAALCDDWFASTAGRAIRERGEK